MKAFTHFLSVLSMLCCLAAPARAETVTVFAAASLKTALDEIAQVYQRDHGGQMITVFAGSAALARQIQNGAPADLFISANPGWVDVLEADGLLHPENRTDLLTNRLVLIAPEGAQSGALEPSLRALPPDARLAVAITNAVPAGIYAKAALTSLGLWDALRPRLAQTDNVRAALRLVALNETPLGIVYATDAMAEPRVQVIAPFPADLHPPILYPMALITPGARPAFDFLTGPSARAIFARHGFGAPK
jgi:molybdate transport system substrate-binding protein